MLIYLLLAIAFSCTDTGFTAFQQSIFFINLSGKDLKIIFYDPQKIDTIDIMNSENYYYGIYSFTDFLPFLSSDSIHIQFEDNKMIKYTDADECFQKSIFCTSTYYCSPGDTTVCHFIIDVDPYNTSQ